MSFFDQLQTFGEGMWETVSDGAEYALGEWAKTGFGRVDESKQTGDAQQNLANQNANQTTTPANQTANAMDAPVFLGLSQKELLIGGGIGLAVYLLARN